MWFLLLRKEERGEWIPARQLCLCMQYLQTSTSPRDCVFPSCTLLFELGFFSDPPTTVQQKSLKS